MTPAILTGLVCIGLAFMGFILLRAQKNRDESWQNIPYDYPTRTAFDAQLDRADAEPLYDWATMRDAIRASRPS